MFFCTETCRRKGQNSTTLSLQSFLANFYWGWETGSPSQTEQGVLPPIPMPSRDPKEIIAIHVEGHTVCLHQFSPGGPIKSTPRWIPGPVEVSGSLAIDFNGNRILLQVSCPRTPFSTSFLTRHLLVSSFLKGVRLVCHAAQGIISVLQSQSGLKRVHHYLFNPLNPVSLWLVKGCSW